MKEILNKLHLSIKEFAELYAIPYNTVRQWANEERKMPEYLKKLIEKNIKRNTKGEQLKIHFSSKNEEWKTPKKLFEKLNNEFNFCCDLCASEENKLCEKYYSKENSMLNAELNDENFYFCNPPYGRKIEKFIKKIYDSNINAVLLLPARTDTKWFHEYCKKANEIRFIKGRLKFDDQKNAAPFPSMIVIFKKTLDK